MFSRRSTAVHRLIADVRRKSRDGRPFASYSPAVQRNISWAGEGAMANANRQRAFTDSIAARVTVVAAGLLILLGIVFQLGQLGYGHINANNWWLISTGTQAAWSLVALHTNGPSLGEVLRFWPLILVSVGLGILMLQLERL
jgi:hypothetical protein